MQTDWYMIFEFGTWILNERILEVVLYKTWPQTTSNPLLIKMGVSIK